MDMPSRTFIEGIKNRYTHGMRIRCLGMTDPYHPVPDGCEGSVAYVDDMATIHVNWDNGQTLGLIPGQDYFKIID